MDKEIRLQTYLDNEAGDRLRKKIYNFHFSEVDDDNDDKKQ